MDRRHQVFVSSTYDDLKDERQHVIFALLELDCIPAGMELFPAADEDAWSLITGVIDDSDYYVLIVAGKYGSLGPDGISFTEMEYDYAVSAGKPIIAFLHEDLDQIPSGKCERSEPKKQQLVSFRDKVQKRHCKFFGSAEDLGGKVSRSLVQLRKRHPSDGWVPGRFAADDTMLREREELRTRIALLESVSVSEPPPGSEVLRQGDDLLYFSQGLKKPPESKSKEVSLSVRWDTLFSYVGPELVGECTTTELRAKIQLCFWHAAIHEGYEEGNLFSGIVVIDQILDQILVQLQALGLMTSGSKRRAVSNTNTYWALTPYGQQHLLKIRALKRSSDEPTNTE